MATSTFTIEAREVEGRAKSIYDQAGALVVKGLWPQDKADQFRAAFYRLIRLRLGEEHDGDLDGLYNKLCSKNPEAGLAIKGMGKDLVEFHDSLSSPEIRRVMQILMGTCNFQINYDQCLFRIDRPDEDLRGFDWHQDYLYNCLSRSAITVWAPLTPIKSDMGPLCIVPGRHDAVLPVRLLEEAPPGRFTGQRRLQLRDLDQLRDQLERDAVPVDGVGPGDVLFLHSLMPHRSGPNRSNRSRWVFNPRYGDLADPEMLGRNWRTARAKDPFLGLELYRDFFTR